MGEVHKKIETISFWWDKAQVEVESYLIKGRVNVMIDTGPPEASEGRIASNLRSFGLRLTDIDLVLNTHGHVDHVGGDAVIKAAGSAQLLLHRGDLLFLEDRRRCFYQFYAPVIRALGREEYLREEEAAFLEDQTGELFVDRRLENNDLIDIGAGIELRVIHLPGHSPGSVGFYWEKEAILFSGDSISGLHTVGGKLPIINDLIAYEKSIERVAEMPLQILFCGHCYRGIHLPPCPLRQGKEKKQYLCDSQEVAKRIGEAVRRLAVQGTADPFLI